MIPLKSNDLVVVDVETSGTNPFRHEVLAVALVPLTVDAEPLLVYIRPESIVWNDFARKNFSNFADDWERTSVSASEACESIEKYLRQTFDSGQATPLGHNVGFDVAFLRKLAFLGGRDEIASLSHRALDTHTLLYMLYLQGRVPSSALRSDGAFREFGITIPEKLRHTALGDALATKDLVLRLFEMLLSEDRELLNVRSSR